MTAWQKPSSALCSDGCARVKAVGCLEALDAGVAQQEQATLSVCHTASSAQQTPRRKYIVIGTKCTDEDHHSKILILHTCVEV